MLTDPRLGSLYEVPEADWTAISQRAGYSLRLANIADEVALQLPVFPMLLGACRTWRATTFPAVVAAAVSLRDFSAEAYGTFVQVQTSVDRGEVDPQTQGQVQLAVKQLAAQTAALAGTFREVTDGIATFADLNRAVDAEVAAFVERLGPTWRSILPAATAVGDAAGLVRGTWDALADDLDALAAESVDVTVPFLRRLQIESSLLAWEHLRAEADAFARMAPGQDQYLSGAWLG